jgi:hypothetical protein
VLPVFAGSVLVVVIAPSFLGVPSLPGLSAWASLFTPVEILLVGLIASIGVWVEYNLLSQSVESIPTPLRWVGRVVLFLFGTAILAYGGNVFVQVVGASPDTAHVLRPELRSVEPDLSVRVDTLQGSRSSAKPDTTGTAEFAGRIHAEEGSQEEPSRNPWGALPVVLTTMLVGLGAYLHYKVQRLASDQT